MNLKYPHSQWFIYVLKEPSETQEWLIRYVGFSWDPMARYNKDHLMWYRKLLEEEAQTHYEKWLIALRKLGIVPRLEVFETEYATPQEVCEAETSYIAYFNSILPKRLVNSTSGGDGAFGLTEDVIERIRAKMKGRKNEWLWVNDPTIVFDLQLNKVGEYGSIREASNFYGFSTSNIYRSCLCNEDKNRKVNSQEGGFIFVWKEDLDLFLEDAHKLGVRTTIERDRNAMMVKNDVETRRKRKDSWSVLQLDYDGSIINEWHSTRHVNEFFNMGLEHFNIQRTCDFNSDVNRRYNASVYEFIWIWKVDLDKFLISTKQNDLKLYSEIKNDVLRETFAQKREESYC